MQKNTILMTTLACAILGVILHFMALNFYFYWSYWWWDVMTHFFVSFTGALGLYWGIFYSGLIFKQPFIRAWKNVLVIFLLVLAIGIGWEMFEFTNGITDSDEGYARDTMNDLILDSAGALLATYLCVRKKHSSINSL